MKYLFIVWSDSYKTGISILDEQFRGLTSLINSFFFHKADATGDIERVLVPTMEMFKSYVKINFVTIEKMMDTSAYPETKKYKEVHQEILDNIIAFDKKCREERDADKILKYLKDYWLETIRQNSAQYVPYLLDYFGG